MQEIELDLEEGADMIMVKPAMPYLDIIRDGARAVPRPHRRVSGERRVQHDHGGGANGWLDHERAMMESLTSITPRRRATSSSRISRRMRRGCWAEPAFHPTRQS